MDDWYLNIRALSAPDLIIMSSIARAPPCWPLVTHNLEDGWPLSTRRQEVSTGCPLLMISTLSSGGANTISTGVFRLVESLIRKFYQIENGIHGRISFHNSNADRCSDGV